MQHETYPLEWLDIFDVLIDLFAKGVTCTRDTLFPVI